MLPIVCHPGVVEEWMEPLQGVWSGIQWRHAKRYVTGLIQSVDGNVAAMARLFAAPRVARSTLNWFISEAEWSVEELNRRRLSMVEGAEAMESREKGCIVIDDTLSRKTGEKMEAVGFFRDPTEGRIVLGHDVVTSFYVDERTAYPIWFALYRKEEHCDPGQFKSKVQLAEELVKHAHDSGIKGKTVLFDSWYFSRQLTKFIEGLGPDWITEARSNRALLIGGKSVTLSNFVASLPNEAFQPVEVEGKTCFVFSKVVFMRKQGRVRLVVLHGRPDRSDEPKFLVTNRSEWRPGGIIRVYLRRWSVEVFYRDCKQHLGFEDYRLRSATAIRRHWGLVLLAYTILEISRCQSRALQDLKHRLQTVGQLCRSLTNELTRRLVFWIHDQITILKDPHLVAEQLLPA